MFYLSVGVRLFPLLIIGMIIFAFPCWSQVSSSTPGTVITTGTVASSGPRTMVVRTDDNRYVLVVFDQYSTKPATIPVGSKVSVVSTPDNEGIQVANTVTVTTPVTPGQPPPPDAAPVPAEVRRLENQVSRQFRRFRAGARAGVGLDPEVILVGLHSTMGPIFNRNVYFRPNAEFGFGEVTTLVTLNLEAIYRLPITEQRGRWSAYVGAGPGLNFIDRDFEEAESGNRSISFNDFDFEGSLNVLAGLEFRSGRFVELKTAVWSRPTLRVLFGFNF